MAIRATRAAVLAALIGVVLGAPLPAVAQDDYPNKTVTLVVPYPPGGGVDVLARVVAEKLSGVLGHQVIVDNRVGGSGLVGTRTVIRSAPDGYTLFLGHTGSISINPSLYAHAGFDPRKDLTAIGLVPIDAGCAARASELPGQGHQRLSGDRRGVIRQVCT